MINPFQKMHIYSAGTSTRSVEEFLEILHAYGIKTVVDVRRFPVSRLEHFRKENMETFLEAAGIKYVYLGAELGGYRKGGYEEYMHSGEFQKGLDRLENIGRKGPTLFICAERLPWRCHRRFIGQTLKKRGWTVVHIIDKNRTWEPGVGSS